MPVQFPAKDLVLDFHGETLVISVIYTGFSVRFALVQDQARAKALFRFSLAYLPLLFALIYLDLHHGAGPFF